MQFWNDERFMIGLIIVGLIMGILFVFFYIRLTLMKYDDEKQIIKDIVDMSDNAEKKVVYNHVNNGNNVEDVRRTVTSRSTLDTINSSVNFTNDMINTMSKTMRNNSMLP